MKKMFKWIINKLIRLVYGADYIVETIKPTEPTEPTEPTVESKRYGHLKKLDEYIEKLADNERIIELMDKVNKSIDEDMVKLKIDEDLKISAIKYNDWKSIYHKIKGFNDPNNELRRLIAKDNQLDKTMLTRKHIELEELHDINWKNKVKPKTKTVSPIPDKIVEIMKEYKKPLEISNIDEIISDITDARKKTNQEDMESKLLRMLSGKDKIIK